jgi:protein-tyrosine phosphatase
MLIYLLINEIRYIENINIICMENFDTGFKYHEKLKKIEPFLQNFEKTGQKIALLFISQRRRVIFFRDFL